LLIGYGFGRRYDGLMSTVNAVKIAERYHGAFGVRL
jgi:hypothetical protein